MKKDDSPARILLVDENKLGSSARKTILIDHGYEVETATNGEEAWDKFCGGHFDIVVTEYLLKGMNGVELIRKIREANSPARVVMLAKFLATSAMTKKNTGADELIAKSDKEVPELLRTVRKLATRPRRRGAASQTSPKGAKQARAV